MQAGDTVGVGLSMPAITRGLAPAERGVQPTNQ
jgi:hypothetical protein